VGCSSNETNDKEKRGSTSEETRLVTQLVTVERTVEETTVVSEEPCVTQEQRPEDILALQYEYINSGDFRQAYALFAEQSRREVSLAQYRGFFKDNAPYSVTDYSFSPALVRGDSASVYAEFTVTSAAGVERLERSQEFVCERDDWRVVMRAEQVVAFTATDDDADAEPTPNAEKESEPTPQPNVRPNRNTKPSRRSHQLRQLLRVVELLRQREAIVLVRLPSKATRLLAANSSTTSPVVSTTTGRTRRNASQPSQTHRPRDTGPLADSGERGL
jgi:hypothetical protein